MGLFRKLLNMISLRVKLIIVTVIIQFASSILLLNILVDRSSKELTKLSELQLTSLRVIASQRISEYFSEVENFTQQLSKNRLIEGMFLAYEGAFYGSGYTVGSDVNIAESAYKNEDDRYLERSKEMLKNYGFENILLVNIDSQVIFSAVGDSKGNFLGRNLKAGSLQKSFLNNCYKSASEDSKQQLKFADFSFYQASGDTHAFVCIKSFAEFKHQSEGINIGDALGVVVVELSKKKINEIVGSRVGQGESGQTFIAGHDKKLRSDMHLEKELYNVKTMSQSEKVLADFGIDSALSGEEGFKFGVNFKGLEVASSYAPIKAFGNTWAVVSEKNASEIYQSITDIKQSVFKAIAIILLIVFIVIYLTSSIFVKPLERAGNRLSQVTLQLKEKSTSLLESSQKVASSTTEQASMLEETKSSLNSILENIRRSSEFAEKTNAVTGTANENAMKASSAMHKLANAMNEIKESNLKIEEFVKIIDEVSKKTEVMNSIAFKTQLLSFNASIEAARAGQYGKGFAVVAQEVGKLAEMSGRAAIEINKSIQETVKQVKKITSESKQNVVVGSEASKITSDTLDEVVAILREIGDHSGKIAEFSQDQANSVEQINVAVEQILEENIMNEKEAAATKNNSTQVEFESTQVNQITSTIFSVIHGKRARNNPTKNRAHSPIENKKSAGIQRKKLFNFSRKKENDKNKVA